MISPIISHEYPIEEYFKKVRKNIESLGYKFVESRQFSQPYGESSTHKALMMELVDITDLKSVAHIGL